MLAYQGLCTAFYDADKPQPPPNELAFYARFARQAGGPVFEPMCGTGRFLVPLVQMGFDIDGADASTLMLDSCRKKLAAFSPQPARPPTLVHQWLHETEMPRRYALILIPAGSIVLVTDDDDFRASLARLHDHLVPGGKLVMNFDRSAVTHSHDYPWVICKRAALQDGSTLLLSSAGSFDLPTRTSRSVHRYEHVIEGKVITTELEDFAMRMREPAEYRDALHAAGFTDVRFWKAHAFSPPGEGDLEQVVECVRR